MLWRKAHCVLLCLDLQYEKEGDRSGKAPNTNENNRKMSQFSASLSFLFCLEGKRRNCARLRSVINSGRRDMVRMVDMGKYYAG